MTTADAVAPAAEGLFSADPPSLIAGCCSACEALHFPRRAVCPECQGSAIEPRALSTNGTVYTFTIVRMSPPGYAGETPYAIGIVELPEGLRVSSTITAEDLETLAIDDPVSFELLTLGEGDDAVGSYAFRQGAAS